MVTVEIPNGEHQQRDAHELWLVMQAAYQQYRNDSSMLSSLSTGEPAYPFSDGAGLLAQEAAEQERNSFEHYIEVRLQYSEFVLSGIRASADPAGPGALGSQERLQQQGTRGFRNSLKTFRPALLGMAAGLALCATVLSVTQEHKRARELDSVRTATTVTPKPVNQPTLPPTVALVTARATPEATQPAYRATVSKAPRAGRIKPRTGVNQKRRLSVPTQRWRARKNTTVLAGSKDPARRGRENQRRSASAKQKAIGPATHAHRWRPAYKQGA